MKEILIGLGIVALIPVGIFMFWYGTKTALIVFSKIMGVYEIGGKTISKNEY